MASRCSKPSAGEPHSRRNSAARAGTSRSSMSMAPTTATSSSRWSTSRDETCPRSSPKGRWRLHGRYAWPSSCASSFRLRTRSSGHSTEDSSTCCCTVTSSRETSACWTPTTRSKSSILVSPRRYRSAGKSRATTSAASRISRPSVSSRERSTPRPSSGQSASCSTR